MPPDNEYDINLAYPKAVTKEIDYANELTIARNAMQSVTEGLHAQYVILELRVAELERLAYTPKRWWHFFLKPHTITDARAQKEELNRRYGKMRG